MQPAVRVVVTAAESSGSVVRTPLCAGEISIEQLAGQVSMVTARWDGTQPQYGIGVHAGHRYVLHWLDATLSAHEFLKRRGRGRESVCEDIRSASEHQSFKVTDRLTRRDGRKVVGVLQPDEHRRTIAWPGGESVLNCVVHL